MLTIAHSFAFAPLGTAKPRSQPATQVGAASVGPAGPGTGTCTGTGTGTCTCTCTLPLFC
jgi:hypothetical protein